jgi:cysteinyl-tRNA synthetase
MKAKLVFNELSIRPAKTESEARKWFSEMITAVADLIKKGICTTEINSNIDLYDLLLTDDYGFIEWESDNKVNRDTRLLASQLLTRKPVQASLKVFEKVFDDFARSEFKLKEYPNIESTALGVALFMC